MSHHKLSSVSFVLSSLSVAKVIEGGLEECVERGFEECVKRVFDSKLTVVSVSGKLLVSIELELIVLSVEIVVAFEEQSIPNNLSIDFLSLHKNVP